MRTVHRSLVVTAMATLFAAAQAFAQTPNVSIQGRVQTQFVSLGGDSSNLYNPHLQTNSAFEVRRLRIQANVRVGDNINLVIQPSFEMSALRMRDAYLRVLLGRSPTSGLGLTIGQEKKPFNRYTLNSSNTLPSIERGLRFQGYQGAVIAQNNMLEDNGYLEHDLGASVDFYGMSNRFQVKLGAYNGSGESARDVNNGKTFAGRVTGTLLVDAEQLPVLRAGVAFVSRDRAMTTTATSTAFNPDSMRRTTAIGIDAEWGDFRPGLHVIADFAAGKVLSTAALCPNGAAFVNCRFDVGRNFGNVRPGVPDSAFTSFTSLQVITAWRFQFEDPEGTRLLKIIEPSLRVDLTNPNTSGTNTGVRLITPAVALHFSQNTICRIGYDMYAFTDPTGASKSLHALRVSWQANF